MFFIQLFLLHFLQFPSLFGSAVNSKWTGGNFNAVKTFLNPDQLTKSTSCHLRSRFYSHGDHVSNTDPCQTCMCFRGDVLCWKRDCPPTSKQSQCTEVKIHGRCCPVYICPVSNRVPVSVKNRTVVAHGLQVRKDNKGCYLSGSYYPPGEVIEPATGPCLECRCGAEGSVVCGPKACVGTPNKQLGGHDQPKVEKPVVNIKPHKWNELRGRKTRP